jgi:hypothetical protein
MLRQTLGLALSLVVFVCGYRRLFDSVWNMRSRTQNDGAWSPNVRAYWMILVTTGAGH